MKLWMKLLVLFTTLYMTIISKPLIYVDGTIFKDRERRIRIFHGINLTIRDFHDIDQTENKFDSSNSFSSVDVNFLVDLGINLVRLGIVWESYEIEENNFDEKYLENINELVNKLGDAGINVIIANEQEAFSSVYCGFGVPSFYVNRLPHLKSCEASIYNSYMAKLGFCSSVNDLKQNKMMSCSDIKNQNNQKLKYSIELTTLYNSFYNNENDVQDSFANYMMKIVKHFSNNRYVIGYDIWSNLITESGLLSYLPGYTTNRSIFSFYNYINDKLKDVDPFFVSLIQPPIYPDSTSIFSSKYKGGFSSLPSLNSKIYAENFSCRDVGFEDAPSKCELYLSQKLKALKQISDNLGITSLITNFGSCKNNLNCELEILRLADNADHHQLSWIFSEYKFIGANPKEAMLNSRQVGLFDKNDSVFIHKIKSLTRPYIPIFQSSKELIKSVYYNQEKLFYSHFKLDISIREPTTLYVSSKLYPIKGMKLVIVFDSQVLKIKNVSTFDGRGINLKLNNQQTNKELNDVILSYISFEFSSLSQANQVQDNQSFVKVFLCPSIRYKYSILHEERAEQLLKFNIKITDINTPFSHLNTKENIFYFRSKNYNAIDKKRIFLYYRLDKTEVDDHISQPELNNSISISEEGLYKHTCSFNSECILQNYFMKSVKVLIVDEEKDLIEWEFFSILNHRVIINFS